MSISFYAQWLLEIRKLRTFIYVYYVIYISSVTKIHERRDPTLDLHDGAIPVDVIWDGDDTVSIHA